VGLDRRRPQHATSASKGQVLADELRPSAWALTVSCRPSRRSRRRSRPKWVRSARGPRRHVRRRKLTLKTPFEIVVDPLATDEGLDTAEYITEEALYSPAYLGISRHDGALTEDGTPSAGDARGPLPGHEPLPERSRERRGAAGRRGVKVREYWSPRCRRPERQARRLDRPRPPAARGGQPVPVPAVHAFPGLPAGRFWADAPMKDLISPQTERNKTRARSPRTRNGSATRRALQSAVDRPRRLRLAGPPRRGDHLPRHGHPRASRRSSGPPEMPSYVVEQLEENEHSIAVISGQNDVAQGTVPEGVTAASAISSSWKPTTRCSAPTPTTWATRCSTPARSCCGACAASRKNDRLARIAGDDASWDIFEFTRRALGDATATP
jgi:hypothetical protein